MSGCGGSPARPAVHVAGANSGAAPGASSGTAPGAQVYSDIEKNTSLETGSCDSIACAGGTAVPTQQVLSRILQPSLDGGSAQFRISGSSGANALWWYKVGPNSGMKNLQFDFWLNVSPEAARFSQALEFDAFQFASPTRYMFGTQCDYGKGYNNGAWDVWDEAAQQWHPTSFPCPGFIPGDWYHITWNFNRTDDRYEHYNSVSVQHYDSSGTTQLDSASAPVNIALRSGPLPGDWTDSLGVQFQLDLNRSAGSTASYTTAVDKVTLTAW